MEVFIILRAVRLASSAYFLKTMENKKEEIEVISWFDDRFYKIDFDNLDPEDKKKYAKDKAGIDYFKSSTTILGSAPKEWLAHWRGQVGNWEANRIMGEAQEKGSRVHEAISGLINGGQIIFNDPKVPKYDDEEIKELTKDIPALIIKSQQEHLEIYRFAQFCEEVKPKFIATDFVVFSLVHEYAGTLDILAEIEGGKYSINGVKPLEIQKGRYIIDIKTGQEDDLNYPKQLASYMVGYEEREQSTGDIDGGILIYTNAKTKGKIEGLKTVIYTKEELQKHFTGFLNIKKVSDEYGIDKPKLVLLPSILKLNI